MNDTLLVLVLSLVAPVGGLRAGDLADEARRLPFDPVAEAAFAGDGEAVLLVAAAHGRSPIVGDHFLVRVRARVPDGVRLHVQLTYHGQRAAWREAVVHGEQAVLVCGPYQERRALAGRYRVVVALFPSRQDAGLELPAGGEVVREAVEVEVEAEAGAGSRSDEYLEYGRRLEALVGEHLEAAGAARRGDRFAIGSARDLDIDRWRKFVDDWRDRVRVDVSAPLRDDVERRVLLPRHPAAYTLLSRMVRRALEISRALSREVYGAHHRTPHPADRSGAVESAADLWTEFESMRRELQARRWE